MALVTKNFSDIITFTRASTGTFFNSAGVLTSAAINAPRFDYNPTTLAARGLLIEEARTNSIRNNTMQGAVAGTPGTLPTNWNLSVVTTTGLTTSVDSVGTENGINYVDLKISGTSSGAGTLVVQFENISVITASSGQTWAGSLYWKIAAGTLNGLSGFQYRVDERSTGFLASVTLVTGQTPTTAALATQRISGSNTLANASTTNIQPYIRATIANGAAIDCTLRIGLPQLELGAFATSVIPTTTTALTRSADVAIVNTLSPWYNASASTLYTEILGFPELSAAGVGRRAANFSDGTVNNRIGIGYGLATNQNYMFAATGGVQQASITVVGTNSAKIASAWTTNDAVVCANGGLVGSDTPPFVVPTVTQMEIGFGAAATTNQYANGWIRRITYYPRRLSNAELQAITA